MEWIEEYVVDNSATVVDEITVQSLLGNVDDQKFLNIHMLFSRKINLEERGG